MVYSRVFEFPVAAPLWVRMVSCMAAPSLHGRRAEVHGREQAAVLPGAHTNRSWRAQWCDACIAGRHAQVEPGDCSLWACSACFDSGPPHSSHSSHSSPTSAALSFSILQSLQRAGTSPLPALASAWLTLPWIFSRQLLLSSSRTSAERPSLCSPPEAASLCLPACLVGMFTKTKAVLCSLLLGRAQAGLACRGPPQRAVLALSTTGTSPVSAWSPCVSHTGIQAPRR